MDKDINRIMETYIKIAKLLEVELSELVNSKFGDTI